MFLKFFHFLCGYVSFFTVGEFPERLLNIFSKCGVTVWEINRKDNKIWGKMTVRDYKKMLTLRQKSRVRTQIIGKFGLPFIVRKYKHRIGFVTGLAIFFVTLHILSCFVWNIRVSGNNKVSAEEIISVCASLGIKEGIKRNAVDTNVLPSKIMLCLDELSWVSLNVEGCILTVNVAERDSVQMPSRMPCNLVAKSDGIIDKFLINNGKTLVKRGQAVKAGELLVSGIVPNADGSSRFVEATGTVTAITNREISYLADFIQTQTVAVAKPKQKTVMTFFGFNIPLYLGEEKGIFETTLRKKQFEFGKVYLPIKFTTKTFVRVEDRAFEVDVTTATDIAKKWIENREAEEFKDAEIMERSENVVVEEGGVRVTAKYKCKENIAAKDLLLIYEE